MLRTLSQNLMMIRKEKNLLQKEVAQSVGITATALSAYEKGQREPSLSVVFKLAEYYGVSVDWLCGKKTERKQPSRASILRMLSMLYEEMMYCPAESDVQLDITTQTRTLSQEDYHLLSVVKMSAGEYIQEDPVYCVDIKFSSFLPWMYDYINDLNKLLDVQYTNGLEVDIVKPWKNERLDSMKDTPLYTFPWDHSKAMQSKKKGIDNATKENNP